MGGLATRASGALLACTLAGAAFLSAAPETSASSSAGAATPARTIRTVLVIGDSITAGYGLDPDEAYPARLQEKIDAAGLPWRVVNAGISGDTTAGGVRRIDWLLRQPVDVFVVALGGNDGLRGVSPDETARNLTTMLERVRAKSATTKLVVAGMQMPPSMGPEYTTRYRAVFPAVASAKDATLIPFLLEGVGGVAELNQGDRIHPNVAGQKRVADNVWAVLEPLLRSDP